jgi:hypothetical protein
MCEDRVGDGLRAWVSGWGGGGEGVEGNLCPRFLFLHVGGFTIKPPTHATRSGVRATSAPPASFLLLQILALPTSVSHFSTTCQLSPSSDPGASYICQTLPTSARHFLHLSASPFSRSRCFFHLSATSYICQTLPTSASHFQHLQDTSYICQLLLTSARHFLHLSTLPTSVSSFLLLPDPGDFYLCQPLPTSANYFIPIHL